MVSKGRRSKARAKKKALRIPGGTLFLFTGTVVILCILLLFINVLYGGGVATRRPEGTVDIVQDAAQPGPAALTTAEKQQDTAALQTAEGQQAATTKEPRAGEATAEEPPIQIQLLERPDDFDIPAASGRARISFVIDDAGYDLDALSLYLAVPMPLAIAVLPKLDMSREAARMVVSSGKELMLHQPMQAENLGLWPGPGAVEPDMTQEEIQALVSENLEELGIGVRGMNNHEGSLITADETLIGAVLDAALDYGVFFMDSRTSAKSMVARAAGKRGMKVLTRDIFIDNVIERDAMLAQIYEGIELANKNGKVIMIGHVEKSAGILPALLTELAPVLAGKGYELVCPSQLMKE